MKKQVYKYDLSAYYTQYKKNFPNSTTQKIVLEIMMDEIQSIGLPLKDSEYRSYYTHYSEVFQVKLEDNLYAQFRLDIKGYQNMEDFESYN